jgi:uncharacterized protein YjeT (DUF2065 family)
MDKMSNGNLGSLGAGIIFLGVGIAMLFMNDNTVRAFGVAFLVGGIVAIFGGIR